MNENGSLVLFTKAAVMLAEANTIQECQELKSLALTAADWARHKGAGTEAVKLANSYAIRAEIKMGEMLKATERAPAGRPSKEIGNQTLPISPTLADLGVTKRESSEAQLLASLPPDLQEQVISGEKTKQQVKREVKIQPSPESPRQAVEAPAPKAKPAPAPKVDDRDARIAQLTRLLAEAQAEIESLKAEKAEFEERFSEQGDLLKGAIEENESMGRVIDAGGGLTAMMAENKRLSEMARVTKSRNDGLMNENADLTRAARNWKIKFEKLQRQVKSTEGQGAGSEPEEAPLEPTDEEIAMAFGETA